MKKTFSRIAVSLFTCTLFASSFLISVNQAYAQSQPGTFSVFTIPAKCNKAISGNQPECGWPELLALGGEVLKFAIFLAVLGTTVAFMMAGFKMITNQGNSGEISKAKDMMTKAAIGIIVTMIAWLIVNFILNQLGVGAQFRLPGM
ncbi:MAG: hypothetical protein RIQ72_376 [Candidatus Parcubacteria bacterium]